MHQNLNRTSGQSYNNKLLHFKKTGRQLKPILNALSRVVN